MRTALCVLLALLSWTGCSKREAETKPSEEVGGNPVTAPADYLGAVAKAKKVSSKTIDTVSLNQAIQLFYAQEDRFPKDLNELVQQQYLPAVPAAPAGMRWEYSPQNGSVKAVRAQ